MSGFQQKTKKHAKNPTSLAHSQELKESNINCPLENPDIGLTR